MHNSVDPALTWLYWCARVCQRFPAYKIEDVRAMPIIEIQQAMRLLDLAEQIKNV